MYYQINTDYPFFGQDTKNYTNSNLFAVSKFDCQKGLLVPKYWLVQYLTMVVIFSYSASIMLKSETVNANFIGSKGIIPLYWIHSVTKYGHCVVIQGYRSKPIVNIAAQVLMQHKHNILLLVRFPKRTLILGRLLLISRGMGVVWSDCVEKVLAVNAKRYLAFLYDFSVL